MIRVLVLGAEAFVGQRVLAALGTCEWARPFTVPGTASIAPALAEADAVANCVVGRPGSIAGTAVRLFAAVRASKRRIPIVHLGSMTVYGSAHGRVCEDRPLSGPRGEYARAQSAADGLAAACPEAVRLRPGCEYGPECAQWTALIARLLRAGRIGDLGAAGDGYCNLLYIDDLTAAILQALRRPSLGGRVFNLAMPSPPTWNEYLVGFAKALGAVPVRRLSRRRLSLESKLMAPPLKIAQILLQPLRLAHLVPPPVTPSLLASARQEIVLDSTLASTALELEWTPLGVGLERAAKWCLSARVR